MSSKRHSCGQDNPFWKCPLCCWGINREMRRSISEPIYYSERLRHRKVHHPKVAVQRWKTLRRKNQPCSASGRAQCRVTNLNWRAAKRKLQLSPELLSKVVTFTWPHVLKRKGKDALSLMTMWMGRSCKCILPRVGKLKKHKCTPGHSGPLQACQKKRLKVLERNRVPWHGPEEFGWAFRYGLCHCGAKV